MNKISKRVLAVLIDFTIILIFGIVIFLYPQISFNFQFSIAIVFLVLAITGIVNYYLLLKPRSEMKEAPFSGALSKYNRANLVSIYDEVLSAHYSKKYEGIARNGMSIKTFSNNGKFPPLFTRGNMEAVEIFVDERLAENITPKELDPLILHELGHANFYDDRTKRLLAHTFLFSLLFLVFSTVLLSILDLTSILFYIPAALGAVSAFSLGIFIVQNERYETLSDKFALLHLEDPDNLKRSLLTIRDFVKASYVSEEVGKRVSRRIARRIKKLNL